MKTERLYFTDCYQREFEAEVIGAEDLAGGRQRVILDRTAFYPASGGQPSDRGALNGAEVAEVADEGECVAHVLSQRLPPSAVKGRIDWPRRFDHMQQHSGQHLLSAAFVVTARLETVSFHMGEEVSTIDLDSDRATPAQIEAAENLANQIVFENRAVNILFKTAAEARQMPLRKPSEREGVIRLIEVENFDLSACGGTHVSRTGEVGQILVRKTDRIRNHTRVEFACGGRALRCGRRDFRILEEAARMLSSSAESVPARLRQQSDELRSAFRSGEALLRRVAEYRLRELEAAAPVRNGVALIRQIFSADERQEAKLVAQAVGSTNACVCLVGVRGNPAALYFSRSPEVKADLNAIMKATLEAIGGSGGGSARFAQGGGMREDSLTQALDLAESLLSRNSG
ncbi:MAG: alanyl-tRNA editing protein [Acidobacteriota bacterium]|nr:alanyl-tRNA editing protein [Acidobacteriota bacterium]